MPADGEETNRFQPEQGNDGTAEQPDNFANKRFQATAHKLPPCTRLPTLHPYTLQPWADPEP